MSKTDKTFTFTVRNNPDMILATAKDLATTSNTSFSGDATSGAFSGSSPAGAIAGEYSFKVGEISIRITEAPRIIPWSKVEAELTLLVAKLDA